MRSAYQIELGILHSFFFIHSQAISVPTGHTFRAQLSHAATMLGAQLWIGQVTWKLKGYRQDDR